jgi:tetratricopeptide (TPR) repeat protein
VALARTGCLALACLALTATVAPAQSGTATGGVKDEDGRPVAGATVVARNPDASPNTRMATTDRAGRYAFLGLRGGVWTFLAGARGFEVTQAQFRVSGLRVTLLPELRLLRTPPPPPGSLEGIDAETVLGALEAADADLDAGRADAAATKYRELLARAPALTSLHGRIGQACRAQGDLACAAREYRAAIAAEVATEADRADLGRVLLEQGDLVAARGVLTDATARPGATSDAWCALGAVETADGQPAAAEAAFARAASLDQRPTADACPRDRALLPPARRTPPRPPGSD